MRLAPAGGRSSGALGAAPPRTKSSITGSRRGRVSRRGRQASSARVYGSRGALNIRRTGPLSRTSPSRITTTSSAISPTSPRSWLMNSTLMRWRSRSRAISSSTWRCTVTSSAVVGSSAISSFGSFAMAIAIITRCCWPPESSCG